ncbi:hypothetical protein [Paraburkholderia sp. BCC1876]|uniref:hypothetical protein n=1 Tax=Paraburkholderia sp. BCC1876 TaxID=2676303 RepID=UPI0015910F43|nr:hypothetical protein [Paraburkholderia sp. BCC1876]
MSRFESLKRVPAETRRVLRERFSRNLSVYRNGRVQPQPEEIFDDEIVLQLFEHLRIVGNNSVLATRSVYDAAQRENPSEPDWDTLISDSWAVEVLGRLYVPREIRLRVNKDTTGSMTALGTLLKSWYDDKYEWTDTDGPSAVIELANSVVSGARRPTDIACHSPEWVAARLWDRSFMHAVEPVARVIAWLDAWNMLGSPDFILTKVWLQAASDAFEKDAFIVLEKTTKFPSWNECRERAVKQISHAAGRAPSEYGNFVPAVPRTLVARALWLTSNLLEHARYDALDAFGMASGLLRILLNEVDAADHSAAPHPIAQRILKLAAAHPDVLSTLLFRAEQHPELVVEMLLVPETSALACLLVFQWRIQQSSWDRALVKRDNEAARDEAFSDSVSIVGEYLKDGRLSPDEVASLLSEMHAQAKPGNVEELVGSESMLVALRAELNGQSRALLTSMFDSLVRPDTGLKFGNSSFAAALDILDLGQLSDDVSPDALLRAYVESIESDYYSLSAARVSTSGAATLYALSKRLADDERKWFLFPFKIKERLAHLPEGENIYTVKTNIARALRVHMQVLSRAIVGCADEAPGELVDALVKTVRASAISHQEKGRVAAFAATYEVHPFQSRWDRPLSTDLAAALGALKRTDADLLMTAILETDEPAFLAQLIGTVSRGCRAAIEQRIEELVPEGAGESLMATEWLLRTDRLLAAGAVNAARAYMVSEEALREEFKKAHAIVRLRHRLQLALLTDDWDAISQATLPSDIPKADEDSARDTILFYQGASQLKKENGSLENAEKVFSYLHGRRPDIPEYGFNLFAARVAAIMRDGVFTRLRGESLVVAKKALADSEQMVRPYNLAGPEADAYKTNKALLLLAVGQEPDADQLLRPLYLSRMTDRIAAYSAVALSRIGRGDEALAVLQRAEATLGESEILLEAQRFLSDGGVVSVRVQVSETNDPLPRIKQALGEFLRMDATMQADVWAVVADTSVSAFQSLVINEVRAASSSIVSLVPMLRVVEIDSSEEDVNAMIRELLTSRLAFMGWSVSDESRGGHTAKGNPGKRDLVIRKGGPELSVIEAVVCNRSPGTEWTRRDLASHFQKLFSYSTCRIFFHLTYAYKGSYRDIVGVLKELAICDAPPHLTYVRAEDIVAAESGPGGFLVSYQSDAGDVVVVFLVLDLGQWEMKEAGKLAAKTSPRAPKVAPPRGE